MLRTVDTEDLSLAEYEILYELRDCLLNQLQHEFTLDSDAFSTLPTLVIDRHGLDHEQRDRAVLQVLLFDSERSQDVSLKIEGLESFLGFNNAYWSRFLPEAAVGVTVHLFIASEGAPSFGLHTDPMHVVLVPLEGVKHVTVVEDDVEEDVLVTVGTKLYLPANVPHRITNRQRSVVLSIGFELDEPSSSEGVQ